MTTAWPPRSPTAVGRLIAQASVSGDLTLPQTNAAVVPGATLTFTEPKGYYAIAVEVPCLQNGSASAPAQCTFTLRDGADAILKQKRQTVFQSPYVDNLSWTCVPILGTGAAATIKLWWVASTAAIVAQGATYGPLGLYAIDLSGAG